MDTYSASRSTTEYQRHISAPANEPTHVPRRGPAALTGPEFSVSAAGHAGADIEYGRQGSTRIATPYFRAWHVEQPTRPIDPSCAYDGTQWTASVLSTRRTFQTRP